MRMLSEDDLNLEDLSVEELDLAWDLWFDTAQTTNEADPPYSHGVFTDVRPAAPSTTEAKGLLSKSPLDSLPEFGPT